MPDIRPSGHSHPPSFATPKNPQVWSMVLMVGLPLEHPNYAYAVVKVLVGKPTPGQ